MSRLHIGCGKTYLPGWINIDIFSSIRADTYSHALALPYDRGTFEMIYASHVLEHFNRHLILSSLGHWRDLLKPEGVLRMSVPNFEAIVEYYQKTRDLVPLLGLLYGHQDSLLNEHHVCFDGMTLRNALERVGFSRIREWDWKETSHAEFDDYSQAYLPHMDKDGMAMSLNLEAVK